MTPLALLGEIGSGDPTHRAFRGDSIDLLRDWPASSVDTIYIDPPYGTGNNGWRYRDDMGLAAWRTMLVDRLRLAHVVLKPTGVIVVAIGEQRHHHVRLMMDECFGEKNFIANVTWQGNGSNSSAFLTGGVDYMLIYARDRSALQATGVRWREERPGQTTILKAAQQCWEESRHDATVATALMRSWWSSVPKASSLQASKDYRLIDGQGRLYRTSPLAAPNGDTARSRADLIHPNGKPCKVPRDGWRASPETLQRWAEEDRIAFGKSEKTIPYRKLFLTEQEAIPVAPVVALDRRRADRYLEQLLGDKRFHHPKDVEELMRWIRLVTPHNGVVLDFFAGSGSTMEAVLRLNADDSGTRECIVCTTNEFQGDSSNPDEPLGVFNHVLRPRIEAVITGLRPDGTRHSRGTVNAHVQFWDYRR